jgi:modification methylase
MFYRHRDSIILGRPNLVNDIFRNNIEHILFFRNPTGYRKPTPKVELRSGIETDDYAKWFELVCTDVIGQQRRVHIAQNPGDQPRCLIGMFGFAGDTVVDHFAGTGTTAVAARDTGLRSISVEIESRYVDLTERPLAVLRTLPAQIQVYRPGVRASPRAVAH